MTRQPSVSASLMLILTMAIAFLGWVNDASAVTAAGVVTIAGGAPGASALATGQPMSAPAQAPFKLKLKILRVMAGGSPVAQAEVTLCAGPASAFSAVNPTCGTATALTATLRGGQQDLAIASGDDLSGRKLWVASKRVSPTTSPITVEFEVTVE